MKTFRMQYMPTLCFSVQAASEDEAVEKAKAALGAMQECTAFWTGDDTLEAAGSPPNGLEANVYIDLNDLATDCVEVIDIWAEEEE